jgi:hypothetical protein
MSHYKLNPCPRVDKMTQNIVWLGFNGISSKIFVGLEMNFANLSSVTYNSCGYHSSFLIACWIRMTFEGISCRSTHLYHCIMELLHFLPTPVYIPRPTNVISKPPHLHYVKLVYLAGHRALIYYELNLPMRWRASRAQKGKSVFLRICFSSELDIDILIF